MRALVLEHQRDAPPALLGEWLDSRGHEYEVLPLDLGAAADPASYDAVISLGSDASAYDEAVGWLGAELRLLRQAADAGVPVLGICFGAQALARALGGDVGPARRPEVGWMRVRSADPALVPAGPWLQWHQDAFTPPPGARVLAHSEVCPQAFRTGPHLGVQFHPEVDAAVVREWVERYPASVLEAGTTPAEVLEATRREAARGREAAFALFDAWAGGLAQAASAA